MNPPSESREEWDRVAEELRAYRQTQRQAWGNLDDVLVARYLAGVCSPEEAVKVEQAMRNLPDLHEVIDVLRAVPPGWRTGPVVPSAATEVAGGTRQGWLSGMMWEAVWLWTRWWWALVGTGLVAALLLVVVIREVFLPVRPELLLASLTAVPRDSRAADSAEVTLDDQGTYRIRGGQEFSLEIVSPRQGVVTLVLLGPGPPTVYPRPGQTDIWVDPFQVRKYGPLHRPEGKTTVLVIVTATPAAKMLEQYLARTATTPDDLDQVRERLEKVLQYAGHRWAAIGRITVEPVEAK
jgi:hypothetical protein